MLPIMPALVASSRLRGPLLGCFRSSQTSEHGSLMTKPSDAGAWLPAEASVSCCDAASASESTSVAVKSRTAPYDWASCHTAGCPVTTVLFSAWDLAELETTRF